MVKKVKLEIDYSKNPKLKQKSDLIALLSIHLFSNYKTRLTAVLFLLKNHLLYGVRSSIGLGCRFEIESTLDKDKLRLSWSSASLSSMSSLKVSVTGSFSWRRRLILLRRSTRKKTIQLA